MLFHKSLVQLIVKMFENNCVLLKSFEHIRKQMRLTRFVFIPSIKIITIWTQLKTFTIEKLIKIKQQCFKGTNYGWFNDSIEKWRSWGTWGKKPNKFRYMFLYLPFIFIHPNVIFSCLIIMHDSSIKSQTSYFHA